MKIIEGLNIDDIDASAICIGKFDGLHLGHQLLINEVVASAEPSLMLTFLFNDIKGIYSRDEKRRLAQVLGIDIYVEIPVTKEFFGMAPESFVRDILQDKLSAKKVVVGEDFRFGKDRTGNIRLLESMQDECGYELRAFEKLKSEDGDVISSSRIRGYIENGDIAKCAELLGRPYSIAGTVVSGNHIGRTIGSRTANLIPTDDKLLPPNGVYATRIIFGDRILYGVGNLGVKPTVGDGYPIGLEVNIFDFDGDIYDRDICVEFLEFIREEKKFDSLDELKKQIEIDIEQAKKMEV